MLDRPEEFISRLGFKQSWIRYYYLIARMELNAEKIPLILKPGIMEKVAE